MNMMVATSSTKSCPSEAKTPDFFKVFLPDHNSYTLRIPPDFIKHFKGNIPRKVGLIDMKGNTWYANMEESKEGVFISNGWEIFVRDKFIQIGSFLVFKYDYKSTSFTIRIFGRNECKREEDFVRVKVEADSEQESEHKYHKGTTFRPKTLVGDGVADRIKSPKVRSTSEVACCKSKRSRSAGDAKCKDKAIRLVEQNMSTTNPSFCARFVAARPSSVNIPKYILRKQGIKLKRAMRVRDPMGKVWPVEWITRCDGRIHLTKLAPFMKENKVNIKEDKLIFEFVLDERRVCEEFKVKFSRV